MLGLFKWRRVYKGWSDLAIAKCKFVLERNDIEYRQEVTNNGFRPGVPNLYRSRSRWARNEYSERNDCYHIYVRKEDFYKVRSKMER